MSDVLELAPYAERAYLEYAMSVVKGRALPAVQDGQKPVQRRILFAMQDMGLTHHAKPVKSARVVGEILGKYHPHGDSSAYEAMVRMAQDFTLRYPLINGIGNFGSRDGDNAAAMRYTEARLTPLAELLLREIHQGTVDFVANYDGAFSEPVSLPARLPMILLNGASGIAVGMATEIPSHNLGEVGRAAIALLKNPELEIADLLREIPAPDFAGGGQIITPAKDLQHIYETGKGSIRVRARYDVESLARGQWRVIVSELPPNTSAAKILAEIEEQTNPKPKSGKKQLTQEQLNTKKLMLDLLEKVRDESDNTQPVRLVFEPKSSRTKPEDFINNLMAQTSLESNVSINMVMIGLDNRPAQKNLKTILQEWLDYRLHTVTRRTQHRLDAVQKRIHILEGRMIAWVHIDEIIAIIRQAENPKTELIRRFQLSETQAEDILEIRLRQLAKLEGIKLESELNELREEEGCLKNLLTNEKDKKKLIIKELQADIKQFGDPRRTLVQAAERATRHQSTVDEPVSLILSQHGWLRARAGHDIDPAQIAFKDGDSLQHILPTRTVQTVVALDDFGRCYNIDPADIPKGRGDGVPIASVIELPPNTKIVALLAGEPDDLYLLAHSGGYGFIAPLNSLYTRQKSGKTVMTLEAGEQLLPPERIYASALINPDCHVVLASANQYFAAIAVSEIKTLTKGRGVRLMRLENQDTLCFMRVMCGEQWTREIVGKRSGLSQEHHFIAQIKSKRGGKGKLIYSSGSLKNISEAK